MSETGLFLVSVASLSVMISSLSHWYQVLIRTPCQRCLWWVLMHHSNHLQQRKHASCWLQSRQPTTNNQQRITIYTDKGTEYAFNRMNNSLVNDDYPTILQPHRQTERSRSIVQRAAITCTSMQIKWKCYLSQFFSV